MLTIHFNTFINDMNGEAEWTHSKSADYTKLGGVVVIPVRYVTIQRYLKRLEKRINRNIMKFLYLGGNNPRHQYRLESSSVENDLGVLVDNELTTTMTAMCL